MRVSFGATFAQPQSIKNQEEESKECKESRGAQEWGGSINNYSRSETTNKIKSSIGYRVPRLPSLHEMAAFHSLSRSFLVLAHARTNEIVQGEQEVRKKCKRGEY